MVNPEPIGSEEAFGTARILIRTHLWSVWGRIAMKHEAMAQDARWDAERLTDGGDPSALVRQGADAALVCVCAAAFAIEALYRRFLQQEFN